MTEPRDPSSRPEILAPAGDARSLDAALASGADAVYFGLDEGWNARARAENFSLASLGETVRRVHRAGARAFVTLNTLVFESELARVAELVREIARAGVDAIIVQDPAVALIARAVCPALHVHASTQMTISSAEGVELARGLGCVRVVVPRELSLEEIAKLRASTDMELEVFVHGALCMSWSGQCLSSEAWGGRSANRGQCAQGCRLPYELVVDGRERETKGDISYLLSPRDLAGVSAIPALAELGIASLKIEGRQKGPAYVAAAVSAYRGMVDGESDAGEALSRMQLTYSRGFSEGFFRGSDHQTLVEGRFPKHRGAFLGRVVEVRRDAVVVSPEVRAHELAPAVEPRPGMGVGFDSGRPEEEEAGGPLYRVSREGANWLLGLGGSRRPELSSVSIGDRVWITGDPELASAGERAALDAGQSGRIAITLVVSGAEGEPLSVRAEASGHRVQLSSEARLERATRRGLDEALLREKLGALGGTPFHLAGLDASALASGLFVPPSALKELRRALVETLERAVDRGIERAVADADVVEPLRASLAARVSALRPLEAGEPRVVPLVRTDEQLDAVIAEGFGEVELDWMEMVGLSRAAERARAAGLSVTLATTRVQKPGEEGLDARLWRLSPDALLVRHWGALTHFTRLSAERASRRVRVHGDFSLNVTNAITAHHLIASGLDTITAAHDLDAIQLGALLDRVEPGRVTVVVHHHVPTFHTEHCVYAHQLSEGRDYRDCGRPCESHRLALRDRTGDEHPVIVDVGCRNTVFNARAQSAASLVPRLLSRGVTRLRVELVWERAAEARAVLSAYRELVRGVITARECVARVGVHEQFGVTRGTMRVIQSA